MDDLTELPFDLGTLHAAYAAGMTPEAIVSEVFRRIDAHGDEGIFLHLLDAGAVRSAARALGPFDPTRYPLYGIPFAVKDNIDVAGAPTTAACPAFMYRADADAFVVAALCEAGALVIGKTNLDQFATGLVGVRTPHAVPRNAIDPSLTPGGSSSGSAVAVATGLVTFALGTDTAGSGRVPAALNNIVGLKPTLGALSATGVVPACRTLDTVSIFATSVADAYRVFANSARHDAQDAYSKPVNVRLPMGTGAGMKVGVPAPRFREFYGDAGEAADYEAALLELQALGAELVPLDFSALFEVGDLLYEGPWVAERYSVIESLLRDDPSAVHPVTAKVIGSATGYSATDAFRGLYRLAALRRHVEQLMEGLDALCVPTMPTRYTLDEIEADPVVTNQRYGRYTNFVNLLDLCALAVPTAPLRPDRPASVTFIACAGEDASIAAIGAALHHRAALTAGATGHPLPLAADAFDMHSAPVPTRRDEMPVAVVGAHMTGLPLNHELRRLGARFLREASTAPSYRLYALPGGPPVRPGLVRDRAGVAIALEVWALPKVAVGDFLAGIPQPLGLGSIDLDDGSRVHGFLCEALATHGAEDVSDHGGWRPFLSANATRRT